MIFTFSLFAVVGFGLGMTVRWPILAIVAVVSLFGGALGLALGANHSWPMALIWAVIAVTVLEAGFMLGSVCFSVVLSKGLLDGGIGSVHDSFLPDGTSQVKLGTRSLLIPRSRESEGNAFLEERDKSRI